MLPGNNVCGVGVAFGAKIGGIRMLDGKIDDRVEGLSLHHAIKKQRYLLFIIRANPIFSGFRVDIYSASWGPTDDGRTVEAPGHLAQEAIRDGISNVRLSIFMLLHMQWIFR